MPDGGRPHPAPAWATSAGLRHWYGYAEARRTQLASKAVPDVGRQFLSGAAMGSALVRPHQLAAGSSGLFGARLLWVGVQFPELYCDRSLLETPLTSAGENTVTSAPLGSLTATCHLPRSSWAT